MALLRLESFDDSLFRSRLTSPVAYQTSASYGLHGDGARLGDTPGHYLYVPVDPVTGTAIMGFALKVVASGSGDRMLIEFGRAGTEIKYDATNARLHSMIQTGSTSYSEQYTALNSVPLNKWAYVEFKWRHSQASAGTFQMGVNGAYTTEDTGIDYFSGFSAMKFGWVTITDVADFYIDDLYVADTTGSANNDFLGPIVVEPLLPNGNGFHSDLVGQDSNSTDNYLNVDEDPPDDGTTYNQSGTQGDIDTYAMEDVSGSPQVKGVVASVYGKRTQTGAKYFRPVTRVSSTDYTLSDLALSEDYSLVEDAWDVNPNTSTAWTPTTLNGAEFGVEVRD